MQMPRISATSSSAPVTRGSPPARASGRRARPARRSRCACPGCRPGRRSPPGRRASRGSRGRRSGSARRRTAAPGMADLAGEAIRAREDRAVDDHGAADADVAVDQEAVTDAAQRAALELAERGEIGVVADAQARTGVAERFAQAFDDRQLIPAEVRARGSACPSRPRPCPGPRCPLRSASDPRAVALAQRLAPRAPRAASNTSVGELVRLSCPTAVAVAHGAAQVADADGDVVDVDLEAERGDAAVVELEDLRGPPDPSAVRETRLGDDAALDQLGDEARDRRLVEPRQLRKLRARERAGLRDAPRDEAQVGLADGSLVCAPGRERNAY